MNVGTIKIRIRGEKPADPRCPYCGKTDPKPETHIKEGRCE